MYYEYVFFYVDDVLYIIDYPLCTMKVIKSEFKLKCNKMEKPYMYLKTEFSNITNVDAQECGLCILNTIVRQSWPMWNLSCKSVV